MLDLYDISLNMMLSLCFPWDDANQPFPVNQRLCVPGCFSTHLIYNPTKQPPTHHHLHNQHHSLEVFSSSAKMNVFQVLHRGAHWTQPIHTLGLLSPPPTEAVINIDCNNTIQTIGDSHLNPGCLWTDAHLEEPDLTFSEYVWSPHVYDHLETMLLMSVNITTCD